MVPAAARRTSGYRDYSDADVARLRFIARARGLGVPLDEIGELIAADDRDRSGRAREWLLMLDGKADDIVVIRAELERMAEGASDQV